MTMGGMVKGGTGNGNEKEWEMEKRQSSQGEIGKRGKLKVRGENELGGMERDEVEITVQVCRPTYPNWRRCHSMPV